MPLFAHNKLTVEAVEQQLKRPLQGDPSRGEVAVLLALEAFRHEDVRRLLERDASLSRDFRDLIEPQLESPAKGPIRYWTVPLPSEVWDEYARLARLSNMSTGQCLAAAVVRDFERRRGALDTEGTLDARVADYHRAATQILEETNAVVQRLGAVQEFNARLARIEKVLAGGQR